MRVDRKAALPLLVINASCAVRVVWSLRLPLEQATLSCRSAPDVR
jgi:hypothetical protein